MLDDLLRQLSRIFSALFGKDERTVALIIAKTRVGRGHNFAGPGQPARPESGGECAGK